MRQSILLLSTISTAALSATTTPNTFEFFFPGSPGGDDPVAEIKLANPSTTIAHIGCPSSVAPAECEWLNGLDYTIISATHYKATMVAEDLATLTVDCLHNTKASQVSCDYSVGGENAISTDLVLTGTDIMTITASITKGASLLDGGATEVTVTSASATATAAVTGTGATMQTEASQSVTGLGSVPESTGAAYRFGVEGSALLALAGAVVANTW